MKWIALRIALAVAFWMFCSGSLSSEASKLPTSQQLLATSTKERILDRRSGGNASVCLLSDVLLESYASSSVLEDDSVLSTTTEEESPRDIFASEFLLHLRGGADDFSFTEVVSSDVVNTSSVTVVHDEELDVYFDAQETLDTDNDDDKNDSAEQNEPSLPPSLSSSLKRKVANRINRWKKKDGRRTDFLDRMARVSDALLESEHDAILEKEEEEDIQDSAITHQSDLTRPGRYFTIVTTAALPWMTGTAVNPLLRAAHLVRKTQSINNSKQQQWVTLVVPWLELEEDRQELYGKVFQDEEEQEDYIRTWLREDADMPDAADPNTGLKIRFYPARYHPGLKVRWKKDDSGTDKKSLHLMYTH